MPIRILLSGCGRMGRFVAETAAEGTDFVPVFGVDRFLPDNLPFPVVASFDAVDVPFDVIIDYSNPAQFDALLAFAKAQHKPLIFCTTGITEEQRRTLREASDEIPVFSSANMSLGVQVLSVLAQKAAQLLGPAFDLEITEAHHRNKVDAPSGTALMLAEAVQEVRPDLNQITENRTDRRCKRADNEIGISSLRGGSISGEHSLLFAGPDEVLVLTHTAYSPKIFATGALKAAAYLVHQPAGFYDMKDVLGLR